MSRGKSVMDDMPSAMVLRGEACRLVRGDCRWIQLRMAMTRMNITPE
jgi:hypothetical protein